MQLRSLLVADAHRHRFVNTIDGMPRDSDDRIDAITPATGMTFCSVPNASVTDLDDAVHAAAKAQPAWARKDAAVRRAALAELSSLRLRQQNELASLLVPEQGCPMPRALGEIKRAARPLLRAGYQAGSTP